MASSAVMASIQPGRADEGASVEAAEMAALFDTEAPHARHKLAAWRGVL